MTHPNPHTADPAPQPTGNAVERLLGRFGMTLRQEWVELPRLSDAEPSWPWLTRGLRYLRWALWVLPSIVAFTELHGVFSGAATHEFLLRLGAGQLQSGLASFTEFAVGLTITLLWVPFGIWLGRHVPHGGFFPNCSTCGREEETLHAIAEGRRACRRCGRVLDGDFARMEPARRRSWRSL